MKFQAALYKFGCDHEGESTVILKVPKSDLPKCIGLVAMTEKLLTVTVDLAEGNDAKIGDSEGQDA